MTCRCEFGWEEMGEAVKQKVVGFTVLTHFDHEHLDVRHGFKHENNILENECSPWILP